MLTACASIRLAREAVDRIGELQVALGHSARIMARQAEVDPVPDAGEFRVMVHFLRVQGDAGQEGERLGKVLELEGSDQRFAAVRERPSLGSVHWRFSCPTANLAQ
jgi:hypothetical protein